MKISQKIVDLVRNENILKLHISGLEQQIKNDQDGFEDKVKVVFKDILMPNQVEIALRNKSKACWTTEES